MLRFKKKKKSTLQLPAAAVLKCGSLTQRHRAVPGSPVGEDHRFLHFARKGAAPPRARFPVSSAQRLGQEAGYHCHEETATWSWMCH